MERGTEKSKLKHLNLESGPSILKCISMKIFLSILFFVVMSFAAGHAQRPAEVGGEFIKMIGKGFNNNKVGGRFESFNNKSSFSVGITYALASQKSYSVSTGFGVYAGYRYAFSDNANGNSPFAGARVLFSFENFAGKSRQNSLLVTPQAELGYHLGFAKRFYAAPSFGFGYTIQLTGDYNSLNEDVGQRMIPSLSAGYRFK